MDEGAVTPNYGGDVKQTAQLLNEALATELARWGVTRVCPLGEMQESPLTWRHDGRPALADLIMWTDWEM